MLSVFIAATLIALPPQDTAHLVVVATTDVHGHVMDWDYLHRRPYPGGLVRVATVVDSLRKRYPGQVIVADAGDHIEGDPFATYFGLVSPRDPNPVIEAMNLIGYDVATLGNHEFDAGLPALRRTIAGAAYPYVSGNIYTLPADTLLFPGYVVLKRQGVRVGVTGFTSPDATISSADLRSKLRLDRVRAAAAKVLSALGREADISLVLAHTGLEGADTAAAGNGANGLASLPVRPSLVVVGNSHREIRGAVINGVHFTQPGPYAGNVSVTHISLVRDNDRWVATKIQSELLPLANVVPSPRVVQRLAAAHSALMSWLWTPVGLVRGRMLAAGARAGPTPIVNFINSVQQKRTGADLSAATAFDLAAGFEPDTIRMGDLFALYPYENTLKAVRISGAQLKQYLEHSAEYFHIDPIGRVSLNDSIPGSSFDIISGARYDIDLRRAVGDRILNLKVRGRAVAPGDSYTLAVDSYRQTGTDGYRMLRGAPVVYDKGENIRELLVREIQERGTIDSGSYAAQDWRIVPEGSALAVRRLFGVAEQPVPVSAGDTILLRIMATGDLHGALVSRVRAPDQKPSGGVAEIASLMDSLAAGCGCATLRLDAGDALQGTVTANVTHGRAMTDALEHMRIAAAAIGERDLEWSVDTLRVRMSEARFPWLAANVFDAASGARPEWVVPSWMFQVGGYRVAVVGYITSDTKASLKPELTATLRFADGALPLHDVLARIRDQKPDLTIVLAHAGMNCEGSACTGEIVRLVEGLEPRSVDLMIVGHNGNGASTRIAGVPIVQGREGGSSLIVADLVKTAAGGKEIRTRLEPVDSGRVTPDAGVADLVATYRRKVESLINRPVATCKFPLVRDGDDSRLGLLIAEARRNVLRADVGLVRHDDIRADLAPGPVSYGQLFEIQSAQNGLVKLTLSGRELQELLEHTLDQQGRPTVHVAGAIVRYDPGRAPLKRIRSIELATGKKFRTGDRYTVATDDFVSSGGAGLGSIAASSAEPGGMLDVDALTLYLRRLPQPFVPPEGQGFTASR